MATDRPAQGAGDFSATERDALELARELSERVEREREVVRRLRAYLAGSSEPPQD